MKLKAEYRQLLKDYPDGMTKEQMYKVCHISKRTALYLLESGLIPCKDSGKQTRRYTIATQDVVDYLIRRDKEPERYLAPDGWYRGNNPSEFEVLPPEISKMMRAYYENLLAAYPDVMNVNKAAQFTGYTRTTVVRWCSTRKLHCFYIRGGFKIPKLSLLDFLMSIEFRGIRTKSEKHKAFIADFRS